MLVCCSTVLTQGQMGLCDKKVGANCGSEDIKRPSIRSKPHHLKLLVSDKNCTILLLGLAGIIIEKAALNFKVSFFLFRRRHRLCQAGALMECRMGADDYDPPSSSLHGE